MIPNDPLAPAAAPPLPPPPTSTQRTQCVLAHALALLGPVAWLIGIVVPGVNVIGPLILHGMLDSPSPLVRGHTAHSVNFQLLAALIGIPLTLLTFSTAGRVVVWIIALLWLALVARAIHQAAVGRPWKPPLSLPLARSTL
ncbi:MAG: DUF4870 domain-containing protein [Verrucomicrobiales bacterium]